MDNVIPKKTNNNFSGIEPRIIRNHYLFTGYKKEYRGIFIEPSFLLNYVENNNNSYFDINLKAINIAPKKKLQDISYWLALSLRNNFYIGDKSRFDFSSPINYFWR